MGNVYRVMKEITLTCRLFRGIEANSEKFEIKVLIINIHNDNEENFSTLVLKNDEEEDIKILQGIISESEENYDRDVDVIENTDKRSGCYIYEMIDAEIIFLGELRIDKKYGGIQVNIGLYQFALIDDENEKNGISDWKTLEKWYQLSTRRMPMLILI
ncbi:hypothetical protein RhiirC2_790698 [Rhizophagus irregularis]|uniref:Uncharacterized protein n=1 Tax=Rhizophagus irregularis TaxID=588596 RepID=A0A2N1MKR2_9GLOM|nr:hypothetical protein RhiirC2_790698 [Rhizophagus irregularis]